MFTYLLFSQLAANPLDEELVHDLACHAEKDSILVVGAALMFFLDRDVQPLFS